MRTIFCTLGLLLLSGCQNFLQDNTLYKKQLQQWRGQSASVLYADWGTPQQTVPLDADTVIVSYYRAEDALTDNAWPPFDSEMYYDALTYPDYGLAPEPPLFYCRTSFVIRGGQIIDTYFNGNDCE